MLKIDANKIPNHIGIIMDGNGRWAKKRLLPRLAGHKAGVEAMKKVTQAAKDLGVKVLTFFAFSTENWQRSKEEVDGIFKLVQTHLEEKNKKFINENVKVLTMGDISKLPSKLHNTLKDIVEKTKNNSGFTINIALNYGARAEIVRACNILIKQKIDTITENDFSKALYSNGLCDPDLVIRTSGEQRLSNFMLYQSAYSELYFTKTYWPDFDKKHLIKAIINYQSRERRFGKIK